MAGARAPIVTKWPQNIGLNKHARKASERKLPSSTNDSRRLTRVTGKLSRRTVSSYDRGI